MERYSIALSLTLTEGEGRLSTAELQVSFCCHRCQKIILFFKGVSALHTPDEETLRWLHVRNAGSGSLETKLELLNNSLLFYIIVKLHSKVLRIILIGTRESERWLSQREQLRLNYYNVSLTLLTFLFETPSQRLHLHWTSFWGTILYCICSFKGLAYFTAFNISFVCQC